MRPQFIGLALAASVIAAAAPVQASVRYVYSATSGTGFVFVAPDFQPSPGGGTDGYMDSCTPLPGDFGCYGIRFFASPTDSTLSYYSETDYHEPPHIVRDSFEAGVFSTVGVHAGRHGSLTITSDTPSGAPEPATWAMLILGMAGVGGALRRTRAALA